MHGLNSVDPGMTIDWGKTSLDYAKYRPGPPLSFYKRLKKSGVGLSGQSILDLGTGTGVLARQFAKQNCHVIGTDISPEQITMAETLSKLENLNIQFYAKPSEELSFENDTFDAITANQCFLYFDRNIIVPLINKFLKPKGVLVTSHFSWLPLVDKIASASEQLILKYNPNWSAHSYDGKVPPIPYDLGNDFVVKDYFYYDELIKFTRDEWRGRMRACRGVGASLKPEEVEKFDNEHNLMLQTIAGETFSILHRIDAHIMIPKT